MTSLVFERMANEDVNQFPVMETGRFLRMVVRDSLLNFIRLWSEVLAAERRGKVRIQRTPSVVNTRCLVGRTASGKGCGVAEFPDQE